MYTEAKPKSSQDQEEIFSLAPEFFKMLPRARCGVMAVCFLIFLPVLICGYCRIFMPFGYKMCIRHCDGCQSLIFSISVLSCEVCDNRSLDRDAPEEGIYLFRSYKDADRRFRGKKVRCYPWMLDFEAHRKRRPDISWENNTRLCRIGREIPVVELYPSKSVTISRGGSALFKCRVTGGTPAPTVTWTRVGNEPFTSSTDITEENGVIMFKNVTGDEQGSYTCTAVNSMGIVTATAVLRIEGPPKVSISPSRTVISKVGDRVALECTGEGEPLPSVTWHSEKRRSDKLPEASYEVDGSASLIFEHVAKSDEGRHTCVAANARGRDEATVDLTVLDRGGPGKTVIVDIHGPDQMSLVSGQSVILPCSAQGLKSPVIRWRRHGSQPLPPNHSVRNGVLHIPQITHEYQGEYVCVVSGQSGSMFTASVILFVSDTVKLGEMKGLLMLPRAYSGARPPARLLSLDSHTSTSHSLPVRRTDTVAYIWALNKLLISMPAERKLVSLDLITKTTLVVMRHVTIGGLTVDEARQLVFLTVLFSGGTMIKSITTSGEDVKTVSTLSLCGTGGIVVDYDRSTFYVVCHLKNLLSLDGTQADPLVIDRGEIHSSICFDAERGVLYYMKVATIYKRSVSSIMSAKSIGDVETDVRSLLVFAKQLYAAKGRDLIMVHENNRSTTMAKSGYSDAVSSICFCVIL